MGYLGLTELPGHPYLVTCFMVQSSSAYPLRRLLSILLFANHLLLFPPRLQRSTSVQADLPADERTSQGSETFSPSQLPPWHAGPVLIHLSLSLSLHFLFCFSFSPYPTQPCEGLSFQKSKFFCQCSVDVSCESFHL